MKSNKETATQCGEGETFRHIREIISYAVGNELKTVEKQGLERRKNVPVKSEISLHVFDRSVSRPMMMIKVITGPK